MNEVNCTSIRRGFDGGNRFGGLRHALHHKGDGCCGAMRSAYCTLRLLTGLGAAGWVLPPVVRRGELVCPGREAGRRASAAGPGMAHRRVPWDKRASRGNPTQEGEQVGEKTFGDFGSFQSHSPSRAAAAKPRRGRSPRVLHGEAMPIRLVTPHPSPLPQGERGSGRNPVEGSALVSCMAKPCQSG